MFKRICYILFFCVCINLYAQDESLAIDTDIVEQTNSEYNALAPAKAAFYSAVIPGLGQAYNKRYWKIPLVYGALLTPLYYYSTNNTEYKRFRRAFRQRAAGEVDEFDGLFSTEALESAQTTLRQNRDTSMALFIGFYALQILEASIDAHLLQFNISDKVTMTPNLGRKRFQHQDYTALSFNFNF